MKLTSNEKAFAREAAKMLETGNVNATECARRAGYSEKTAKRQGYRIMKKPEMKEYLDQLPRTAEIIKDETEAGDSLERSKVVIHSLIGKLLTRLEDVDIPQPLQDRADGMTVTNVQTQEAFDGEGNPVGSKTITEVKEIPPDVQAHTVIYERMLKVIRLLNRTMEQQRLSEGGREYTGNVNVFIAQQDIHL